MIPVCGFAPNQAESVGIEIGADVIVTAAPTYVPLAALSGKERFPKGAQLLLIHAGKPESTLEPLVAEFAATADANISFDGKRVLFAGRKDASDPWQIWEVTLADRSLRKLVAGEGDAIRPFYLPGGRLVYARRTVSGFQLETVEDGSPAAPKVLNPTTGPGMLPLTYMHANALPADVLADGRILFESGFPLGSGSTPEMYLVYADGSGVESYRCDHGRARWGGRQLANGDVVFTHGATLARFTSPLAHEDAVAAPRAEYDGAIAETASGAWLVSVRSTAGAHYALKLWRPGSLTLLPVRAVSGANLVDPVVVVPRDRPKRHPSGLHPWDYANMLALDARLSREGDLKVRPAMVRLETLDASGRSMVTGTAPIEPDGSFFVKTPADKPIRFSLLDKSGVVLRQEHGWFWIRSGEQRICVGCHVGPERASENHVPAVLLRSTTPVDLTGVKPAIAPAMKSPGGN
ncbi:MAG: hypothetical protein ABR907_02265 [Terracidiphilus sp.]